MNLLRNLFGGGAAGRGGTGDKDGYYVYVQPHLCKEVVEVRINLMNDLSQDDSGGGYIVRKIVRGQRCPFPSEITLYFNANRQLIGQEIDKGKFLSTQEAEGLLGQ